MRVVRGDWCRGGGGGGGGEGREGEAKHLFCGRSLESR